MREGESKAEFAQALDRWSVQELIDAGEAIESLRGHPGLDVLDRVLCEARDLAWQRTVRTGANSEQLGQLNRSMGLIDGLDAFPDAIATLKAAAEAARQKRAEAAELADRERQAVPA